MSSFEISPLFDSKKLNPKGAREVEQVSALFTETFNQLKLLCNADSREFAIVRSKLEEACFYAKKSISQLPENQEQINLDNNF